MGKATTVDSKSEQKQATSAPTCQHHWIIETPRGATSTGRCKRCGEEREFRNSANDHLWEDESGGYGGWRSSRSAPKPSSDDDEASLSSARGEPALIV
jgi:hypothetical protein